ncbi:MAG: hypothetical protein IT427_18260 [Pirellulales bacterium]|nr:hypothetical protein [Pirellulales bacterium]
MSSIAIETWESLEYRIFSSHIQKYALALEKALVSALIKGAVANFMTVLFPAIDVGAGQLLHEGSQVAIVLRPEKEVPMVRSSGKMRSGRVRSDSSITRSNAM